MSEIDRIDVLVDTLIRIIDNDEVLELSSQIGAMLQHHRNGTAMAAIALLLVDAAESTPDGLSAPVVLAVVKRLAERMLHAGQDKARA